MSKRLDQQYLDFDPYMDECEVKYSTTKIVVTKTPHTCWVNGEMHDIPIGTRCRFQKAMVEGVWATYYACLDCMDLYMDEEPEMFPVLVGQN